MEKSESEFKEIEAEKIKNDIRFILKGMYLGICFVMFFVPLKIIIGFLL